MTISKDKRRPIGGLRHSWARTKIDQKLATYFACRNPAQEMIARILKISSEQSILKRRRRMYKNVIDVRKDALQDILHALAEAANLYFVACN